MWRPYSVADAWRGSFGVYLALVALCSTLAGWGALTLFQRATDYADALLAADQSGRGTERQGAAARQGFVALTEDWNERLRTNEFWSGRDGAGSGGGPTVYTGRNNLQGPTRPASLPSSEAANFHDGEETTYRTVCVRLCDGYFWPISFATTEEHFGADQARCESSCGSTAKLYVYKNPGNEPEEMRDLNDKPYTKLPTAFLFRTKYQDSCKCQAQPWELQAQDRHKLYALDAAKRKGNKTAAIEAELLKARMEAERRQQLQAQKSIPIVTASIVASNNGAVLEPSRTLELRPPAVGLPPKAKTPPKQASNGGGRPAGIMRAGASNSGGNSGRSAPSSAPSDQPSRASGGDWKAQAFRGN